MPNTKLSDVLPGGKVESMPLGSVIDWPIDQPIPEGFLECGRDALQAEYPALYALLGSKYGQSWPDMFSLPELRPVSWKYSGEGGMSFYNSEFMWGEYKYQGTKAPTPALLTFPPRRGGYSLDGTFMEGRRIAWMTSFSGGTPPPVGFYYQTGGIGDFVQHTNITDLMDHGSLLIDWQHGDLYGGGHGGPSGTGLFRFPPSTVGGEVRPQWITIPGVPSGGENVTCLAQRPQRRGHVLSVNHGTIYVGTPMGLYTVGGDQIHTHTIYALTVGDDGIIYAITGDGLVYYDPDEEEPVWRQGVPHGDMIQAWTKLVNYHGHILLGGGGSGSVQRGLFIFNTNFMVEQVADFPSAITGLTVADNGSLIVSVADGAYVFGSQMTQIIKAV